MECIDRLFRQNYSLTCLVNAKIYHQMVIKSDNCRVMQYTMNVFSSSFHCLCTCLFVVKPIIVCTYHVYLACDLLITIHRGDALPLVTTKNMQTDCQDSCDHYTCEQGLHCAAGGGVVGCISKGGGVYLKFYMSINKNVDTRNYSPGHREKKHSQQKSLTLHFKTKKILF